MSLLSLAHEEPPCQHIRKYYTILWQVMAVDHLCAGSFETLVLYRLHALFPSSLPSLCLTKWTRLLGLEAIRLGSEKCEVESWLCGKYGRQCSKRVYLSRKFICGLNLLSAKHHYLKPGTSSAPGWQYAETIGPLISDHAATLWDYQIWVTFNCCLSHILMVCLLLWYSVVIVTIGNIWLALHSH